MTVLFSPVFNDAQLGTTGLPANGYQLFTYLAGSSTKQATYTDNTGNTAHSNPIILNSRGEPTSGPIWLTAGVAYDFVFTSPTDSDPPVAPIRTVEDVQGVNDPEEIADEWLSFGFTPTYVGATQFTVPGDQTSTLSVGRRVRVTDIGGTKYATITVSAYTSLTTVTLSGDALASPTTALSYGIVSGGTSGSMPMSVDSTFRVEDNSDRTKKLAFQLSGFTTGNTRTVTPPDEDFTIVGVATSQTLTNKTLTSPAITTPTITSPVINTGVSGSAVASQSDMNAGTSGLIATTSLNKIALGTPSTTTGGTAISFTGLPTGIREITFSWSGLSGSGTSNWLVQIGDATTGNFVTSGYESNSGIRSAELNSTAGFILYGAAPVAASVYTGSITLSLLNSTTNRWIVKCGNNAPVSGVPGHMQGDVVLAGALDRIRITATNGTDTFDANAGVNITYVR